MHLAQRVAAIVLTLGLSASLVGCGFHLRGTNPSAAPLIYQKLNFAVPENADLLEDKLSVYFSALGVQVTPASDAYVLRILDYTPRRHELNGKLVETLLRLTVTFQIEDAQGRVITAPRTVTATRSYQYDVATVNTDDQEESYLNNVLINDIAQQISRQVYSNRLPSMNETAPTQTQED